MRAGVVALLGLMACGARVDVTGQGGELCISQEQQLMAYVELDACWADSIEIESLPSCTVTREGPDEASYTITGSFMGTVRANDDTCLGRIVASCVVPLDEVPSFPWVFDTATRTLVWDPIDGIVVCTDDALGIDLGLVE